MHRLRTSVPPWPSGRPIRKRPFARSQAKGALMHQRQVATESRAPHAVAGRIMVVHDDPAFTRTVRLLLHDAGYFVIECNVPENAVFSVLRGDEYDMVLINVSERDE